MIGGDAVERHGHRAEVSVLVLFPGMTLTLTLTPPLSRYMMILFSFTVCDIPSCPNTAIIDLFVDPLPLPQPHHLPLPQRGSSSPHPNPNRAYASRAPSSTATILSPIAPPPRRPPPPPPPPVILPPTHPPTTSNTATFITFLLLAASPGGRSSACSSSSARGTCSPRRSLSTIN